MTGLLSGPYLSWTVISPCGPLLCSTKSAMKPSDFSTLWAKPDFAEVMPQTQIGAFAFDYSTQRVYTNREAGTQLQKTAFDVHS